MGCSALQKGFVTKARAGGILNPAPTLAPSLRAEKTKGPSKSKPPSRVCFDLSSRAQDLAGAEGKAAPRGSTVNEVPLSELPCLAGVTRLRSRRIHLRTWSP